MINPLKTKLCSYDLFLFEYTTELTKEWILHTFIKRTGTLLGEVNSTIFSSPRRSPGRAIVLPPASASALAVASALAKS